MAKQMRTGWQAVTVVLLCAVWLVLWQYAAPWLLWRIPEQPVVELILAVITLGSFLHHAIRYRIKPFLWLLGILVLLGGKLLFFPNDFALLSTAVWQERLPMEWICVLVPILFCVFGYLIHAVQVRRWRMGK